MLPRQLEVYYRKFVRVFEPEKVQYYSDPVNWERYMWEKLGRDDLDNNGLVSWNEFWAARKVELEALKDELDENAEDEEEQEERRSREEKRRKRFEEERRIKKEQRKEQERREKGEKETKTEL